MQANKTYKDWKKFVSNNITIEISKHIIKEPGIHILKFWMVDPGIVLQKLVVDTGGLKPSYLGPPESYHSGGSGAFVTGNYRNLFVEAGHSQEEVTAKINSAFRQLFHGDRDTQAIYFPAGTNANGALATPEAKNTKAATMEN